MIQVTVTEKDVNFARWEARKKRSFPFRRSKTDLLHVIDATSESVELEKIALDYDMCDVCDFRDLNWATANSVLHILVNVYYVFPRIRSNVCYLGSKRGYISLLRSLCDNDRRAIDALALRDVCSLPFLSDLAGRCLDELNAVVFNNYRQNVLAQAYRMFGLLDGVIFDEADFRGLGYRALCSSLRYGESTRFHPVGCGTPDSVIYHEFGHLLDYLCNISDDADFLAYRRRLSDQAVTDRLSSYATTDNREFVAEAIAEYYCNANTRELSAFVWDLLGKK